MKTSLKICLTVIFVLAVLLCFVGAVISLFAIFFDVNSIINTAFNFHSTFLSDVLYIASSAVGIAISLGFALFFVLVAIGCIIGIVYVFVGANRRKMRELEEVISNAYESENNDDK